ncbi:MAG: PAS domain S-box protein, partial [Hyphomicrobiales bacterium]|nr:PAS domain S-box protein [Hyphomicrobiales bacterium]
IAGTLAYMAPEQTGRMNRSTDSRSDLYSLGVTFYRMLTGALPFSAADPMEWVHCHIARKPPPPAKARPTVPAPVSEIVMKLLAKTADERYQTASGLLHDLSHCLLEWERDGRIDPFHLGRRDLPDRVLIPEKLYGRQREVEALLAAFARVVETGAPELVLISGYSGVGKSSVVNELHKALVAPRGLFASGKFDQLKRDIPYWTLAQAFQSLVRSLLGRSEAELATWRDGLRDALGSNGRLVVDLVPELSVIVGEQPPIPELEPQQAKGRFQITFRRFIGVFATADHPLALFLDDLQWVDSATVDLVENLLTQGDVRHLLVLGACRDNEIGAGPALMSKLEAIRESGARLTEIRLAPLAIDTVARLIADALACTEERAEPLAKLVHAKTAGNPFFTIQFLHALAEEGLLAFDHSLSRWAWDLDRIRAKRHADNVAELMVENLARLPRESRKALQQLACLGNVADVATLAIALEATPDEVHAALWEALRAELIERLPGAYKFAHDRVHEAAYSLIPEGQRALTHLRLGRLLAARTPPDKRDEAIFDRVHHLNRGAGLIVSPGEREQLAGLNLIAGKRARAAAAYAAALAYFAAGSALLPEERWRTHYELAFELERLRAECEYLTGQLGAAEQRLSSLSRRALNWRDQAIIACLRMNLLTALDRREESVELGLNHLRQQGAAWPAHPSIQETQEEYQRLWDLIGAREISSLIDLPVVRDSVVHAKMDILATLLPPALFTDENLLCQIVAHMAITSIEEGNTDGSCLAYVWLGLLLGPRFNRYQAGFEFGRLGVDLMERRGLARFRARVYLDYSHVVNPWLSHAREGPPLVRRAFEAANEIGDLTFAAYSACNLISAMLAAGDPLQDVQREAEQSLEFANSARYALIADIIMGQLALILALRGVKPSFDEKRFEKRLDEHPGGAVALAWYFVRKLQRLFFAGDFPSAVVAAERVEPLLWTIPSHLEIAEYHFFSALARAAAAGAASGEERDALVATLNLHHRRLQFWAANCPQNFEGRAALVGAEIARIEQDSSEAMRLYELAIRSARASGFANDEALANELAGKFYAQGGFEKIARAYLEDARDGYLRWGAEGKAKQLQRLYPQLRQSEHPPAAPSAIEAPVEQLDLGTVIKVSQAIASEIVFDRLIDTLMRTAIEQAGAERGLLILAGAGDPTVAAQAVTEGETVAVSLRDDPVSESTLPESMLHTVQRTVETVILDDAAAAGSAFAADPYVRARRARSVLCLPLTKQGKLVGVLYLENNLASGVFAPARIAILKLLASQAAIALENTQLYRELAERETRIRRLVDSNIVGIFTWRLDGRILEANDAFLAIVGHDRADVASGRLSWRAMSPADWLDRDERERIPELKATTNVQPYEKEFLRKDGSRVPVLIGGALIDETSEEGVAFVLDLSERKRAEEKLSRSEAYLAAAESLAKIGSWAWRPAANEVTHWSQGRYHLFGFDPADGVPTLEALLERIHPEDRAGWLETTMQVAHGGDAKSDFRIVLPDGTIKHVHAVGHPILNQSGDVVEIIGAAVDVSEQIQAQEALRESEEQWRAVFENNPTMYFMVDPEAARILSVNPFGAEHLGYAAHELLGQPIDTLIREEDRELARSNNVVCLERLGRTSSWELQRVRKDGKVIWARETGRAMLVKNRPVVLIASEDITEARQAAAALREMETLLARANRLEAMGQLTASIAHEVNQPIASTLTNAQAALRWLRRAPPDWDEVSQGLERIVRDAVRAGGVVQRVRDLTKKGARRDELVDMNAVIHEVIDFTRSETAKNRVSVQTEFASDLQPVRGDRVEFQQVLLNLILNAVEAMSLSNGPRSLQIATRRTDAGEALVSVRDSGPGLPPDVQENLFKAFFTTKPRGLGLGLSICRSIVEAHGGQLSASANSPHGAVFQFTVPSKASQSPHL